MVALLRKHCTMVAVFFMLVEVIAIEFRVRSQVCTLQVLVGGVENHMVLRTDVCARARLESYRRKMGFFGEDLIA